LNIWFVSIRSPSSGLHNLLYSTFGSTRSCIHAGSSANSALLRTAENCYLVRWLQLKWQNSGPGILSLDSTYLLRCLIGYKLLSCNFEFFIDAPFPIGLPLKTLREKNTRPSSGPKVISVCLGLCIFMSTFLLAVNSPTRKITKVCYC
jgi:hypothetical protein